MPVIADTGPLYALLDADDAWHERVVAWWTRNREPIIVPVSVIPEVAYLLQTRISTSAELAFIRAVVNDEFAVESIDSEDMQRAGDLMERYDDFPLGFVDASVIALAERFDAREILTSDRRHFGAVRPRHVKAFALVP